MLSIAKIVVHGTLCFAIEIVAEPLVFVKKIHVEYAFSTRKLGKLRPFQSKKLGAEAMLSSDLGRARDLANPLAFEPLSL